MERIMSENELLPKDVKPAWLNPIRAAQAACKDNRGYAVIEIKLLVNGNEPVLWFQPIVQKIHPAKLGRQHKVSIGLLEHMLAMAEVDNTDSAP